MSERIDLSIPHLGGREFEYVRDALESNWIAPNGEYVRRFEEGICSVVGSGYAVGVSSGTAALHLALRVLGVDEGDEVICPTFSFAAPANAILYCGAKPVLIDSARGDWHMDLELLEGFLKKRAESNRLPKAMVVVSLYGACGDMERVIRLAGEYGVSVVEDSAEALGCLYKGRAAGSWGRCGVYSFNGNKVITTSGGGMLVTADEELAVRGRHLASQARVPGVCFEHDAVGYNYAMSNILASIGVGQLEYLDDRVEARRRNFESYKELFSDVPEICSMPVLEGCYPTHWLSCFTVEGDGGSMEVIKALEAEYIGARTLWKPIHLQKPYEHLECIGGEVSESLFGKGICLPSSSSLREEERVRIAEEVKQSICARNGRDCNV